MLNEKLYKEIVLNKDSIDLIEKPFGIHERKNTAG